LFYRELVAARSALPAFAAVALAHLALLIVWDLGDNVFWFLACMALGAVGLWWAVSRLGREPRVSFAVIVVGSVILRLLLVPLPPTLSDDAHRYVWDGRVAGAGFNPYLYPPEDIALESLRDERWPDVPHRDVATVYPPLALTLFTLAARFPAPVLVLKGVLTAADVVLVGLLVGLADRRGAHRSRVLWYAWSPLASVEVAGMAHIDALGVAAVTAAVVALTAARPRAGAQGVLAATAVLAKLVPLVAWPAWVRRSPRPLLFAVVSLGLVVVACLPVILATGGLPSGYVRFGVSWEFNGPLFEPLWRLLAALNADRFVTAALDLVKRLTAADVVVNRLYPLNYPQFQAKLLLVVASAPFFVRAWRVTDVGASTGRSFGVLVLFSATVYPWYLLWVLPWAALLVWRPWLLLAALAPLSYLPQVGGAELFPWVWGAVWLPFLGLVAWEHRWFGD
jgi:hypothetical protein